MVSTSLCRSQGLVVVWELQLERRGRPERVSVSWEHRGQAITALCWDTSALRVFAGDSAGRVTFLRAGSSKLGKVGAASITSLMRIAVVSQLQIQIQNASFVSEGHFSLQSPVHSRNERRKHNHPSSFSSLMADGIKQFA